MRPESEKTLYIIIHMPCYQGDSLRNCGRLHRCRVPSSFRFVSRRDLAADMYSDNGTNFHGADRELRISFQAVSSDSTLQASLANDGVQYDILSPGLRLILEDSEKYQKS